MDKEGWSQDFSADWDQLTAQARDEKLLGGGYDKPLQQLLDACRGTELGRFFPFTSMARLCFARSRWPFQDIQPVLMEFDRNGTYTVRDGGPYPADRNPPTTLKTHDPAAAVAEVIRLLRQTRGTNKCPGISRIANL